MKPTKGWQQVYDDLVSLFAGKPTRRQREDQEDAEVLNHLLRYRIIDRNGRWFNEEQE